MGPHYTGSSHGAVHQHGRACHWLSVSGDPELAVYCPDARAGECVPVWVHTPSVAGAGAVLEN